MSKAEVYEKLPFDLSGAISKNRFRNELLWGLGKLYEIYNEEDFCIIFDYNCDIEIHFENRFEFYQIKTNNKSTSYTINKLSKTDKSGKSIFGKIYLLKDIIENSEEELEKTKIAVVSNVPLRTDENEVKSSIEIFELNKLKDKSKNKIINNIKKELKLEDVDLKDTYYIYTSMDLFEPENSLIGKTAKFIEKITGKEPEKIMSTYRVLHDVVNSKGSYECECNSYNDVKEKKGITKKEFEMILEKCIKNKDEYIKKAKEIVSDLYEDYFEKVKINRAISRIYFRLKNDKTIKKIEKIIVNIIMENEDKCKDTLKNIINTIMDKVKDNFVIEDTKYDRIALIIIVLAKYEEGLYE